MFWLRWNLGFLVRGRLLIFFNERIVNFNMEE